MTDPHVGKQVDRFSFRELLEAYDYSRDFLGTEEIEVLLDAVLIEALARMRERGYIDGRYIFGSDGNGVISVRDTSLEDDLSDLED